MLDVLEMRRDLLKMALAAKGQGAHLGGSLSAVEIMAVLYGGVLRFDRSNPAAEDRDRLIFGKGHGVMAQYVAMKQCGLLTEEQLLTYKQTGSVVSAHPAVNPALGIDFASGSLGQALSLGVGMALGMRRKGNGHRVFVILGDGECDEGSVWEAAASAAHYGLANLVAVVDRNVLQYDGPTEEVMALGDFAGKWRAFGWRVVECDGHDMAAIEVALGTPADQPLCVIANTVKGKGVSFMEGVPTWHHSVLTQKVYDQAMAELTGGAQ